MVTSNTTRESDLQRAADLPAHSFSEFAPGAGAGAPEAWDARTDD